jgi:hypothetical protein
VLVLASLFAVAPHARAEPSADDKKAAQASFVEGQRAFRSNDYRHAAESFEEAYRRAPHYAPLWNAGRAWHRAGDLARAANLYARYLREAPPAAPDRDRALEALKELQPRIGRIDVHATDVSEVTVDGDRVDGDAVYVVPGAHVVEGKTPAHETVRVAQSVAAGEGVSVALVPPVASATPAVVEPATPVPPPDSQPPATPRPDAPAPAARTGAKGLSPVFAIVGGVLTLAAGGVTVWSGLDTSSKKREYLDDQTQAKYDSGKAAQLRTNVLLGATGALFVATGVTAVFFTNWSGSREGVAVRIGPGGVSLQGSLR